MTGGDKTNDNGKKMMVDNGQKKNENVIAQNGQNKHSPKTKDDVRYMEGKNGHNTKEVEEKMVSNNGQKKNKNMVTQNDQNKDQEKLVAENGDQKKNQTDKAVARESPCSLEVPTSMQSKLDGISGKGQRICSSYQRWLTLNR